MVSLGAQRERIVACLGPSISRRNYEVGSEFVERFVAANESYATFFRPSERDGHAMFDLPGLTIKRLVEAGVAAENLDICTYADEERFFSYRRTTHRQEPDYGRQISAICIRGT
jgi:copper oxidase (laccase) domain-containing protein